MRLLDRILWQGFGTNDEKINLDHTMKNLRSSQLVVIDNVATYCSEETKRKRENDEKTDASDFPNVRLPFPHTFFDMRLHRGSSELAEHFDEVGLLMEEFEISDFRNFMKIDTLSDEEWSNTKELLRREDVTHVLSTLVFVRERYTGGLFHMANFVMPVTVEEQVAAAANNAPVAFGDIQFQTLGLETTHAETGEPFTKGDWFTYLGTIFMYPGLLALSFMHCRNVEVRTEMPPAPLSRKHQQKTGRPLLKYRLLQIDPMKQVLEREGRVSEEGLKRALHKCRGHFVRYGVQGRKGLLFGKHVGVFWVPKHERGTIEQGIVIKDYEVKKG